MSYAWGNRSNEVREELHIDLVLVVDQVLEWTPFDITLTEGFRGPKAQTDAFESGLSELKWPASRHNMKPARAVHVHPYPVDFEVIDQSNPWLARYHVLAGMMMAAGGLFNVELRWLGPTTLRDYAHWELPKER